MYVSICEQIRRSPYVVQTSSPSHPRLPPKNHVLSPSFFFPPMFFGCERNCFSTRQARAGRLDLAGASTSVSDKWLADVFLRLVVSTNLGGGFNCLNFRPYLGKISNLTNIFSKGLKPPTSNSSHLKIEFFQREGHFPTIHVQGLLLMVQKSGYINQLANCWLDCFVWKINLGGDLRW